MLECVANVSEGRRPAVVAALARACGASLLDVHRDPDHDRSVLTLAGPGEHDVEAAARRLAAEVAGHVDLRANTGVHPRLGALDVVPFVALAPTPPADAVEAARRFAAWAAEAIEVPVFLYGDAAPGRSLPEVRRRAFSDLPPDEGPARPHPRLGATVVGARPPLVAVNCELDRDDLALARALARAVRERDGGLPGVRALGFRLESRGVAQVSMNLVDLGATGLQVACEAVRDRARAAGAEVARVELVGLIPAAELRRCSAPFLAWTGIDDRRTVEARLVAVAGGAERGAPAERGLGSDRG